MFPVRPELVEGVMWFDRLTTNGVKIPAMLKHDKVKLLEIRMFFRTLSPTPNPSQEGNSSLSQEPPIPLLGGVRGG